MSAHPEFADAISAYALQALDAAEARALEAHLATCADCRAELAELRRAVSGIGLNAIREEVHDPPIGDEAKSILDEFSKDPIGLERMLMKYK